MKALRIEKINWQSAPDEAQAITVSYRRSSDPDIPVNYTTVSSNVNVAIDGTVSPALVFELPLENTQYVIKYKVNAGGAEFTQTVTSPWSYTIGSFLDKTYQAMPNMQYTIYETGLRDSYLPEHIGLLHEFKSSFGDSLEQFGNAQYTLLDNNKGIEFVKRANEIGLKLDSNVTSLYPDPTEDEGNNELSLLGHDGKMAYTIGIWVHFDSTEFAQTNTDGKLWLWYSGNPTNHVGAYINTATKYVHWVHKKDTVTEENILDHAVEANKWIRINFRRDGLNPSDGWLNQMLMKIDSGYYSPSTPTLFTAATDYEGLVSNPIYIGMGKNQSTGNIMVTQGVYKYFYYRQSVVDNGLRERVLNPFYPRVVVQNVDGTGEFTITPEYFVKVTNNDASFVFPHDTPTGSKKVFVKTYSNERAPIFMDIIPFTKDSTGFDIDFTTGTLASNREMVTDKFYALHKAWGGYANGGVVAENIYVQNNNLMLECHGDVYDGSTAGVNRDGTTKVHTIQDDPIWGTDPKFGQNWTERTGGCIVSKDYLGFGRYLIRCKIPNELGVAPAWWTFHYEEVYLNTPDYELLQSEGLKRQGNFADGYYIVRNHEIDIEQPSHLAMGVFNGWLELENNVIFYDVNDKYHIGIQNDTEANNGLWRLVNTSAPNNRASWTKVSTFIAERGNPDYGNLKCNTWIGEGGFGNGWRFKDPMIPDSQNDEEYLANLTPIDIMANDGEYHDYEWRWYKDRVEFYFDGELVQTNYAFIPDIPSRLTIGNWFPSSTSNSGAFAPWKVNPASAWAGSPADWNFQKMVVQRILFEPYDDTTAGGPNRLIGESYPFDGIKEIGL